MSRQPGDTARMQVHRLAGLALAAAALVTLGVALGSERFAGLNPCELCLWQRWPYRVAIALGLLAAVLPPRPGRRALQALAAVFAVAAALALLHVGVEQGWWPSPAPGCSDASVAGASSVDDLMARLRPAPGKPCDEPAYLIPGLPVSMAAMNLVWALVLTGATVLASRRRG